MEQMKTTKEQIEKEQAFRARWDEQTRRIKADRAASEGKGLPETAPRVDETVGLMSEGRSQALYTAIDAEMSDE